MNRIYFKNFGIYHQHAKNSSELASLIASGIPLNADEQDFYQIISPEVINKRLVNREDRAVLNFHSKIVLNALSDLGERQDLESLSDTNLYSACDSEEFNFSALREVINRDPAAFWQNITDVNKISNPLELLRLLPTNPLYHVSRVLKNHKEGLALDSASLSGLSALKLACADILHGSAKAGAIIINSANMLSFDNLVVFSKFGELKHCNDQHSGIVPSWGSIVAHLDHDPNNALAEILDVTLQYQPMQKFEKQSWLSLFEKINNSHGAPDVIISYENGITSQSESELTALHDMFPDIPVINYKHIVGYGGKINNLIDIACAISDERIKTGAKVLFNGSGIMYGLGYALIQKMRSH